MKKAFVLLVMLTFLAACGNQTNISENMLDDTHQVLDTIEDIAKDEREDNADEIDAINGYKVKYDDTEDMSHDEMMVRSMTMNLMNLHNNKDAIDSANAIALEEVEEIRNYIKTGEVKE